MNWVKQEIHVGAEKPFRVLHLSDTHMIFVDDRDDKRKLKLAENRRHHLHHINSFLEAAEYAKAEGLPILHTGDFLDFVSWANIDKAREITDKYDVFMAAGNHEYSLYMGEAFEDEAYRNLSLEKVQSAFKNNIRCDRREICGVNFVAIDNGYYLMNWEQLNFLKAVAAEGKPVVLMIHVPLYTEEQGEIAREKGESMSVMGAPEALMGYYDELSFRQQLPDEPTKAAYEYITHEPMIKAILTGHEHTDRDIPLTDTVIQYQTGVESVREIVFT